MSNFSDKEDMMLVRITMSYVNRGKRVRWADVTTKMKHSKKTRHVLRERFKTLKRTYGKNLDRFPKLFSESRASCQFVGHSDEHEAALGMLALRGSFVQSDEHKAAVGMLSLHCRSQRCRV